MSYYRITDVDDISSAIEDLIQRRIDEATEELKYRIEQLEEELEDRIEMVNHLQSIVDDTEWVWTA